MKMSLSPRPPLSYYCVSLKEKGAGEEGKWKEIKKKENLYADILYKPFNKREFNLLLAFRI